MTASALLSHPDNAVGGLTPRAALSMLRSVVYEEWSMYKAPPQAPTPEIDLTELGSE